MAISVEDMQNRMRSELSTGSRLGHTAVGVAGLGMAALALSLLATEPVLPVRTQAAFAVIAAGRTGLGGFAGWVLTRRRVLLAQHHVAASALATVLTRGVPHRRDRAARTGRTAGDRVQRRDAGVRDRLAAARPAARRRPAGAGRGARYRALRSCARTPRAGARICSRTRCTV